MPQQVPRLVVVFAVAVIALLLARWYLVPETFGEIGHYRAAAVDSVAARPVKYAGQRECAFCHGDVVDAKAQGNHRGLSCEGCHGPAAMHVNAPMDTTPVIPRGRDLCVLCHAYNPSRPTGFPQIDPVAHNPRMACNGCHTPHAPEPPVTPRECSACHGQIATQLSLSHHAGLECSTCHEAPTAHRENPRLVRPTKPTARAFCGACHAGGLQDIPQIDLQAHNPGYLCWQCHYPHNPEAR